MVAQTFQEQVASLGQTSWNVGHCGSIFVEVFGSFPRPEPLPRAVAIDSPLWSLSTVFSQKTSNTSNPIYPNYLSYSLTEFVIYLLAVANHVFLSSVSSSRAQATSLLSQTTSPESNAFTSSSQCLPSVVFLPRLSRLFQRINPRLILKPKQSHLDRSTPRRPYHYYLPSFMQALYAFNLR